MNTSILDNDPMGNQTKIMNFIGTYMAQRNSSNDSGLVLAHSDTIFKNLLDTIYSLETSEYNVYHLWLDCLYNYNVNLQDIISELSPVLNTGHRRSFIKRERIYIIGHKLIDGTIKPSGSCYIILPDALIQCPNCNFDHEIFAQRIHMIKVSFQHLEEQLINNHVFVLSSDSQIDASPARQIGIEEIIRSYGRIMKPGVDDTSISSIKKPTPDIPEVNGSNSKQVVKNLTGNEETKLTSIDEITKENMPRLKKIASRARSVSILAQFDELDHLYIRFRCTGTDKVHPSIFRYLMPKCVIQWHHIFVTGKTDNSISGVAAIPRMHNAYLQKLLSRNKNNFRIGDKVTIVLTIIYLPDFRSQVLNFKQTSEFVTKLSEPPKVTSGNSFSVVVGSKIGNKITSPQRVKDIQQEPKPIPSKNKTPATIKPPKVASPPGIDKNVNGSKYNQIVSDILNHSEKKSPLKTVSHDEKEQIKLVSKYLPKLISHGEIVLKVENLPLIKLTSRGLNILLGTKSITSGQVAAAVHSSLQLMSLRIVMQQGNDDIENILMKDKTETSYSCILICKRTNLKELERFLVKNYDIIQPVEDEAYPIACPVISYGGQQQQQTAIKSISYL